MVFAKLSFELSENPDKKCIFHSTLNKDYVMTDTDLIVNGLVEECLHELIHIFYSVKDSKALDGKVLNISEILLEEYEREPIVSDIQVIG